MKKPMQISALCRLVACMLALLTMAACGDSSASKTSATPNLTIIQTGRLRGNIFPAGVNPGTAPLQYHGIIAGYVQKTRNEAQAAGGQVLLVDIGDSLGGSFASHVTGSQNVVTFFNTIGYNAVVLGNLDADIDPAVISKLEMPVAVPFETADGQPAMPGTKIMVDGKAGAVPFELIANFYGDENPEVKPERFPVNFGGNENVRSVRDYSKVVGNGKPDGGLRLFSWFKFESPDKAPEAYLAKLTGLGVDAVLAHRIYSSSQRDAWSQNDPYITWTPPVSQNILRDNRGFVISRTDLARDKKGWRVLNHELVPMVANLAAPDPGVETALKPFAAAINAADAEITDVAEPMDRDAIMRRYMEALATIPDTDAVVYSPQSIRSEWAAGSLRAARVYDALPWTNPIIRLEIPVEEFAKIRESGNYAVLSKKTLPASGKVNVITSAFFARILARSLGMELSAPVIPEREFDFFLASLRENGTALAAGEDWIYGLGR